MKTLALSFLGLPFRLIQEPFDGISYLALNTVL